MKSPATLFASGSNRRPAAGLALCLALCVLVSNQALAQNDGTPVPQAAIEPKDGSPSGLVLASGFGLGFGLGHFYATPSDPSASSLPSWYDRSVDGAVSGQLPFSFGVAYRPIPLLSFGLTTELAKVFPARCSVDCAGAEFHLGGELRFHFRTGRSLSPWFSVGFGYELLHFETDQGSATLDGYGTDVQVGGDVRVGHRWTVGPYAGLRIGTYTHISSRPAWRGAVRESTDLSYEDLAIHAWVTFGVRGTFTFSLR